MESNNPETESILKKHRPMEGVASLKQCIVCNALGLIIDIILSPDNYNLCIHACNSNSKIRRYDR